MLTGNTDNQQDVCSVTFLVDQSIKIQTSADLNKRFYLFSLFDYFDQVLGAEKNILKLHHHWLVQICPPLW